MNIPVSTRTHLFTIICFPNSDYWTRNVVVKIWNLKVTIIVVVYDFSDVHSTSCQIAGFSSLKYFGHSPNLSFGLGWGYEKMVKGK